MDADAFDNTLESLSSSVARSFLFGDVVLTADFTDATLSGRIFRLEILRPGPDEAKEALPSTTRFQITDGAIVGDEFTATITGEDDDADASLDDSVRGFAGDVAGQFYGPDAREFAGIFGASRAIEDDDDWTILGWLGGKKDRDIAIDNSPQLSSLVNRNYASSETSLATSDSAMVATTADGYRITFTVDGVQKSVDVAEADLGGISGNTYNFEKVVETASVSRSFWLWRWQGSFPKRPEYDYLDVNGVILADFTPGVARDSTSLNDVWSGYVVRGTRTSTNDMPTGSASYSGRMHAREWPTDTLSSYTDADEYRGDFSLTADFAAGTVMATVSNVVSRRVRAEQIPPVRPQG